MRILIPAYFYPGPIWDTLIETASDGVSVIINPNSGPGALYSDNYGRLCVQLRKRGIDMLGYVATGWGERPMIKVHSDIDTYRLFYGIQNTFLDEAATSPEKRDYYGEFYRDSLGMVILNPGTIPDESYTEVSEVLVIFEDSLATHKIAKFPSWLRQHPRDKFAQIVHTCPKAGEMRKALARIKPVAGWAYVTDDVVPNPYDSLPGYWREELKVTK